MAAVILLSDFGTADGYVGVMKGIIQGIAPGTPTIDLTHDIPAQDVRAGAYVLATHAPYFPPGSIFLAVVDPGVGGSRQAIAAHAGPDHLFVGPDNGLLSHALAAESGRFEAHLLENPSYWRSDNPSRTFHGRDIFAPVAAHLALGTPISALGRRLADIIHLPQPALELENGQARGEIVYIDRFGNAITSIKTLAWGIDGQAYLDTPGGEIDFLPSQARIGCGWHTLNGLHLSYNTVEAGQPLALIGSSGALEIAISGGSAAQRLGLATGDSVTLFWG